jgi:hypothetical protein
MNLVLDVLSVVEIVAKITWFVTLTVGGIALVAGIIGLVAALLLGSC